MIYFQRHIAARIERVFQGTFRHSISPTEMEVFRGAVAIDQEGKIIKITKTVTDTRELMELPGHNRWLIAKTEEDEAWEIGRVDTHLHAPQYPNRGLGIDLALMEWLKCYTFPEELRHADPAYAKRVYEQVLRRLIKHGTTTALMYGTVHKDGTAQLIEAAIRAGINAHVGKVHMHRNGDLEGRLLQPMDESLADSEELIKRYHLRDNGRIQMLEIPRFGICVEELGLRGSADLAEKYRLRKTTHLAEQKDEDAFTKFLFARDRGKSYAEIYAEYGFLDAKTIQAHCIWLSDTDLNLMLRNGVGVAHCPSSNTNLMSSIMHLRHMMALWLPIGLGSDISGGPHIGMNAVMREAIGRSKDLINTGVAEWPGRNVETVQVAPFLSPAEAYYLATIGGAHVLGREKEIGRFEEGKYFDALKVNYRAGNLDDDFVYDDEQHFTRNLLEGDDRNIKQVWVRGRKFKG